jgi:hypothetical protein
MKATTEQMAEIICYADSKHYLIRFNLEDGKQQILTDRKGKIQTFNSQYEAKNHLHRLGHTQAKLYFESAYDEFAAMKTEPDNMVIPLQ